MKAEKKMTPPTKPPTHLPTRKETAIVGTLTDEVKSLDAKYFSEVSKFEEDAERLRKEQEGKGEGSIYAAL